MWRELKAESSLHPPKVCVPGTAACAPLYLGDCSLGKSFFPICLSKDFYRTFRTALNSGKHLENVLLIWILQIREWGKAGAEMWVWPPCKSSRVLVVPFTWGFLPFPFCHTEQFPSCLPSQAPARAEADPHPCRGDLSLQRHPCFIQEPSLPIPGKLEVWNEREGSLSLLWGKPSLCMWAQAAEEILPLR